MFPEIRRGVNGYIDHSNNLAQPVNDGTFASVRNAADRDDEKIIADHHPVVQIADSPGTGERENIAEKNHGKISTNDQLLLLLVHGRPVTVTTIVTTTSKILFIRSFDFNRALFASGTDSFCRKHKLVKSL